MSSRSLSARFVVRSDYPLWTNRRYLNGIIELTEFDLNDALLEEVIMGVMNDVKSWLINQGFSYSSWSSISLTPTAIVRATTLGVAASLYARKLFFPVNRVLIRRLPVDAKIVTNREDAMDYWENRMGEALESYYSQFSSPILLEEEDAVFTMDDIPFTRY
jgi:hypothetical protein